MPGRLAAAAFGIFLISDAHGQQYTITDLGLVGGVNSTATCINSSGEVAGYCQIGTGSFASYSAFATGSNGSNPALIPGSSSAGAGWAFSINDSGWVTGEGTDNQGDTIAFLWRSGSGITSLGTLWTQRAGGYQSYGESINGSGQITGYTTAQSINGSTLRSGFITAANGGAMTALPTLPGVIGSYSWGEGINASGQVTGYAIASDGGQHAFITGANGAGITDLGGLGVIGGHYSSWGQAINASGQVCGNSANSSGTPHAFITGPNGQGMTDLDNLGTNGSFAVGMNSQGKVVGLYYAQDGTHEPYSGVETAFIAQVGSGLINLNNQIPANSGWTLTEAYGINDSGQISGVGTINGQSHAFLLNPIDPSTDSPTLPGWGLMVLGVLLLFFSSNWWNVRLGIIRKR